VLVWLVFLQYQNKGQAERATQEATHWQQVAANTRKSHNKNHYQAMLDDTNNIYFYRIRSRDAAGRLTGLKPSLKPEIWFCLCVTLSIRSYSYSRLRISSTLLKFDLMV
jgi:hypothetical protein